MAHIVGWQQEVVEAGVGSWQAVGGRAVAGDDKGWLQRGQSLDGHAVRACHKEEQPLLLLLAEAVHHFPEPCDHLHPGKSGSLSEQLRDRLADRGASQKMQHLHMTAHNP
jgi:hypothetical protein